MAERAALAAWLKSSGLRQAKVAGDLSVAPSTLCEWVSGKRTPTLAHALSLELMSEGAVPIETFGFAVDLLERAAKVRARRLKRARAQSAVTVPSAA